MIDFYDDYLKRGHYTNNNYKKGFQGNFSKMLSKTLSEEEKRGCLEILFESNKYMNEYQQEFWFGRELYLVLGCKSWTAFLDIIDKAKAVCDKSNEDIWHHFIDINKTVPVEKRSIEVVPDIMLSGYACYLIMDNCTMEEEVAIWGKCYFAVKIRNCKLRTDNDNRTEYEKRMTIRADMRVCYDMLTQEIKDSDEQVQGESLLFEDCQYVGLYGSYEEEKNGNRKGEMNEQIMEYLGCKELLSFLLAKEDRSIT